MGIMDMRGQGVSCTMHLLLSLCLATSAVVCDCVRHDIQKAKTMQRRRTARATIRDYVDASSGVARIWYELGARIKRKNLGVTPNINRKTQKMRRL